MSETAFGRYTGAGLGAMASDVRSARDLVVHGRRGRISGPFKVWLSNPKLVAAIAPLDEHVNFSDDFSLSPREREIAILVIASEWRAAYVIAAHARSSESAGLSREAIQAIIAVQVPVLEDERERLVYDLSIALCKRGVLAPSLYDRGVAGLGHAGLSDLVVLVGYYTAVSLTVNAYDVAALGPARSPSI